MSDAEVHKKSGDAAVAIKRVADGVGSAAKSAYDDAAKKSREAMKEAEKDLSDAALKAKVQAGFKLIAGLDASNVSVEAKEGKVFLKGTVPTQLDKMKVEGVAYGVTGDSKNYVSEVTVKK